MSNTVEYACNTCNSLSLSCSLPPPPSCSSGLWNVMMMLMNNMKKNSLLTNFLFLLSLEMLCGPDGELPEKLRNLEPRLIEHVSNEIMDRDPNVRWDDIGITKYLKLLIAFQLLLLQFIFF